jgi:hypothetical protein
LHYIKDLENEEQTLGKRKGGYKTRWWQSRKCLASKQAGLVGAFII